MSSAVVVVKPDARVHGRVRPPGDPSIPALADGRRIGIDIGEQLDSVFKSLRA
jgi:hypothetical protein